jgi:DeoR/GlpR family transcriptional regulator of sugar metabolism
MLQTERRQSILNLIEKEGALQVNELVRRFSVSEMTLRRDLAALERQGLLRRVHGGAISDRGRSFEPPFLARRAAHQEEKRRIGQAAAALIKNGDSITLDVGTTTLEIARNLAEKQDLTVLTPSFQVAAVLSSQPGIRLILTGGILRPGELSLVGHVAERTFQDFYVDKLFLGAAGIDLQAGLTEYNLEDTLVKHAMLRSAKQVILVADASKFNRVAFAAIAPMKSIHTIITDASLDSATVTQLRKMDIDVILAS